jgi:hypothetical protein
MVSLGKVFNSLRDGMSQPQDWFQVMPEDTKPESLKDKIKPAKKDTAQPPPTQPDEEIF